jgi:hypothetical protein
MSFFHGGEHMTFGNRIAVAAVALSFVAFCTLAGTALGDLLYQFSLNASSAMARSPRDWPRYCSGRLVHRRRLWVQSRANGGKL